MSVDSAYEYIKNSEDGRSKDIPVIIVRAGTEPPMFSSNFLGWNAEVAASKMDPAEAKLRALKGIS